MSFNHISLFSGGGGFDVAAEWMGWDNIAHCEINEFCLQILKYYWPNATTHTDIKSTDFTIYRGLIDIVSGGFPCQPYSVAGKRKGTEDERHLWPEMLRAIREIQPPFVVGENVPGIVSWDDGVVFEQVQADLETEGYEVQTYILPVAGINGPHARHRVWFIAYCESNRGNGRCADSNREKSCPEIGSDVFSQVTRYGNFGTSSNSNRNDAERQGYVQVGCTESEVQAIKKERKRFRPIIKRISRKRTVTYARSSRLQKYAWSKFKSIYGQEKSYQGSEFSRIPAKGKQWRNWPTQSPLCDGDDGFSAKLDGITFSKWRKETIKLGGNSVSPELVFEIFTAIEKFKAIEQYENIA